ncbi:MAG: hypothetical protein LBV54_06315 [Puniceicoccales bacterium]|jgi:hypothetical protein|nr:hypothetical protein [Puniceicoccales bacterium]
MSTERSKGWVGSLVVHGLLLSAVIFGSGLGVRAPEEKLQTSGSLVLNFNGNGSPAPGSGKGRSIVPKGKPDAKPKQDTSPFFDAKKVNAEIKRLRAEEDRRAAEADRLLQKQRAQERLVAQKENSAKPTQDPKKTDVTTLEQWLKDHPGKSKPPPATQPTKPGKPARNGPPITSDSINVKNILGNGPGLPSGIGEGGDPNGGGPIRATYVQELKLRIQAHWLVLIEEEGASLDSTTRGVFRLNISNNGNLSFDGWNTDPRNQLFERLLRRAIDNVRNIGPRPAGMPSVLSLSIDARLQ